MSTVGKLSFRVNYLFDNKSSRENISLELQSYYVNIATLAYVNSADCVSIFRAKECLFSAYVSLPVLYSVLWNAYKYFM